MNQKINSLKPLTAVASKRFLAAAMVLTLLMSGGCSKKNITGKGTTKTETRSLPSFDRLILSVSTDAQINYGFPQEVKVSAYENLLPHLSTNVTGTTLKVAFDDYNNVRNDNSSLAIVLPAIKGISTNGSSDVQVNGPFETDQLVVWVNGSSEISLDGGATDLYELKVNGSGNIKSYGFVSSTADVFVNGSGTIELTVTDTLKGRIQGNGKIYYKGDPSVVAVEISGNGQVIKK